MITIFTDRVEQTRTNRSSSLIESWPRFSSVSSCFFFLGGYFRDLLLFFRQENPRNRISKFQYFAGDSSATLNSEEVLLTTVPKFNSIHAAGWCGFKPSAYGDGVRRLFLLVFFSFPFLFFSSFLSSFFVFFSFHREITRASTLEYFEHWKV